MKRNWLLFIVLALVIGNIGYSVYINRKIDRIVVVDVIKVFNEFNMKKDLESRVGTKLDMYTMEIDSLKGMLEYAQKLNDSNKIKYAGKQLYLKQSEAQQVYEIANKNINEQVWKRLNPMIDEYAKLNGYRIVIGANGMGGVLYYENESDRTKDLIHYINSKYEKGN